MPLDNPAPGPNSAVEYMVAGVPFITSSAVPSGGTYSIAFPFVTRDVKVRNVGTTELRVGVTQNGVDGSGGANFFSMPGGSSETFDIRTRTIFVKSIGGAGSVSICAGMTGIQSRFFPLLTGSISGSNTPGVG